MNKKVLIVYEKMGMGHRRMADILEDILKEENASIIKCAGSEMIGDTSINIIVKLWNFLIRKNLTKTADMLLNFILRIFILPFIEVSSTSAYHEKLQEINPDIIICTADGFNKAIGSYAKEKGIPFYIFITEISIFIDLVNPYATHLCYFNEVGEAIRNYDFSKTYYSYELNKETTFLEKIEYILKYYKDFVIYGYKNSIFRNPQYNLKQNNDAKFKVIGPLAEKKHFKEKDINKIKEKYGFNNNNDTVMIASGSIGGKILLNIVKNICRSYNKPLNLIVICGKDEKTYNKIQNLDEINIDVKLIPFKFIENFDEILAAVDCIIARPSAGIFIESLINKIPEITFQKATSNDKGTLSIIEKYNIGKVINKNEDIKEALEEILSNKDIYKENINNLLNMYCNSYEDKKKILKETILYSHDYDYNINKCLDAKIELNVPLSH
ncbi:Glycosyltransferase family 28 C-terminal domain-containing protein [Clostridium sp. USBA 49]|uniref:glycosyltransferase n=1 Tax=Clostridium TaxID=1485 RepID=UPI0009993E10|nr:MULTISPECIES: glycosyltransferase [Clostridium]SKA83932.1 Glycosyltransferase family 28 C-terminal domain-containing protein [Clostridium sp. USBA 49]